jgi:hypothetical protein
MLKQLIGFANHLDSLGLTQEADYLDKLIMSADDTNVSWHPSEWAEDGQSAYKHGHVIDAYKDDHDGKYRWTINATKEISEWPELITSSGMAMFASLDEAKAAAEKAFKSYIKKNGIPAKIKY